MKKRIAVVGCGVMGRNHARTMQYSPDMQISHIIDSNIDNARSAATEYGDSRTFVGHSADTLDQSTTDAVIIASPSQFHAEQAINMMEQGLDVLVEKPIALTIPDAEKMKQTALRTGRVLMAGHVELFNPVICELRILLADSSLRTIRFKRLGAVKDVGRLQHEVVNDLMLHDIAIANQLIDPDSLLEPVVVHSFGRKDTGAFPDPAEALIDYGNGVDAHFRASRAYSGGKVRSIEAETGEGVIEADLLTKQITRRSAEEGIITSDGTLIQDIRSSSFFAQEASQPL